MSIRVDCACGATYKVKDQFAGRTTKCRDCGERLLVPEMDVPPLVEAEPETEAQPEVKELVAEPVDTHQPEIGRPKPVRRKRPAPKRGFFNGFADHERSWTNKGVVAGILMMVGAVVWFVLGLVLMDIIFFYPPVLFVVGLAVLRGLLQR